MIRPSNNLEDIMNASTKDSHGGYEGDSFLRRALFADGFASGGMGLALVVAAAPAAQLLGYPAGFLLGIGAFCVVYAAFVSYVGAKHPIRPRSAWRIVIGNVAWVIASIAFLATGAFDPTALGQAFVIAQAAVVALLAEFQYLGLKRVRAASGQGVAALAGRESRL
jgi:hypothetical protein